MSENIELLNSVHNVAKVFQETQANYYFFTKLLSFDEKTFSGTIEAARYRRKLRLSFDQEMLPFEKANGWEFPDAYGNDKTVSIQFYFPSEETVRILVDASISGNKKNHDLSPMVDDMKKLTENKGWKIVTNNEQEIAFSSSKIKISVAKNPFKIRVWNSKKEEIFNTVSILEKTGIVNDNPIPTGFIQRSGDASRCTVFSSIIKYDEKFFGCGESFTRLNKRGQVINMSSCDTKGVCTPNMYKPVPFFVSNKNYGVFIGTTYPVTVDFGHSFDGCQTIYSSEDVMDLIIYEGNVKKVLSNYTDHTGRSPMPPEWSFGLWMGRITYNSQAQVMEVAEKLRKYDIPCDVIHIDTGWFDEDWKCDFKFSSERFTDVKGMLDDLHKKGFHVSLWQLPYFTPLNPLYKEITENGINVHSADGGMTAEDAILDMTNKDTIKWYQEKLKAILDLGVDVIKTDFGEAAPYNGVYANGKSGLAEHNVYPVRYQKAVSELTQKTKGYGLVWARSAWAGSQKYPVHWGGDAENTNYAMASTLRAGLSFGLSGFSFWSHDIGGFVKTPEKDLYLRWLAFAMFSSHARCHGNPPREPWEFGEEFMDSFRKIVKIRYNMMDYIVSEAKKCSENGWPMIRPIFFEIPEDKTGWELEDQYFFGSNLLVAPLFEDNSNERNVYLPLGSKWQDYFTGETFDGGQWKRIKTDNYIVVLKRVN